MYTGRKVRAPKALHTSGTLRHTPPETFKFRVPEMPFPSFCSGSVAKYEGKFCEGAGKDTVFVFHPTITLLPSVYGIMKYLYKDTTFMRKRFQSSRLNDTDFSCTYRSIRAYVRIWTLCSCRTFLGPKLYS